MRIAGFTRINTQIRPGAELAVVHLDDGEEDMISTDDLRNTISEIRDSISGVAVDSFGSDPLSYSALYKLLKSIAVPNVKVMLSTEGSDHSNLDDVAGAGYIDSMNLLLDSQIDIEQMKCIDVMRDNGLRYMATVTVVKGSFDRNALSKTVKSMHDAMHVVIRNGRGPNALTQKEMSELTKSLKGSTKDLRVVL